MRDGFHEYQKPEGKALILEAAGSIFFFYTALLLLVASFGKMRPATLLVLTPTAIAAGLALKNSEKLDPENILSHAPEAYGILGISIVLIIALFAMPSLKRGREAGEPGTKPRN